MYSAIRPKAILGLGLLALMTFSVSNLAAQDDDSGSRIRQLEKQVQQLRQERDSLKVLERNRKNNQNSGFRTKAQKSVSPFGTAQPRVNVGVQQLPESRFPEPPARFPEPTRVQTIFGSTRNAPASAYTIARGRFASMTAEEVKLNKSINAAIKQIREGEDDEVKKEKKEELKGLLEEHYDRYLEKLEAPLKEMEERVKKLREEYDKKKAAREELVKLKVDSIWYEANGMSWPGNTNSSSNFTYPTRSNLGITGNATWSTLAPTSGQSANRPTLLLRDGPARPSAPAELPEPPKADLPDIRKPEVDID